MKISIKQEFNPDYISREAGERLRMILINQLKNKIAISLDFSDCIIASTSFFDEAIAKLALEAASLQKNVSLIKFENMHRRDQQLLKSLCDKRKLKINI